MSNRASTAAMIASAPAVLGKDRISVHGRRPFIDPKDGKSYVIGVNAAGKLIKVNVVGGGSALLQYDEWKDIDRVVIPAAIQRMTGVEDLRSRGLIHNLGSIGLTVSLWDRVSDMTPANVDMSAVTQGEKDTPAFRPQIVPVPVIHKDFQVELRRLVASRQFGEAIDTTAAALAARLVGEKMEEILFMGNSEIQITDPTLGAARIYGYTTYPDRNRVNLQTPWDELDGAAGENVEIIEDVMAMQAASRLARFFGPWVLYIPAQYEGKLDEDYRGPNSSDTRTVKERILALTGIEDVKVADFLTGDNVLLVSMTRETIDLAIGQDLSTVQWTVTGGMVEEFKVMMVGVPRTKSDYDGRCGITHLMPEAS